MTYWNGIYVQNEKDKTQFIKDVLKEKDVSIYMHYLHILMEWLLLLLTCLFK